MSSWDLRNAIKAHVPGEWVASALCGQTDPELFFPENGQSAAPARMICRQCKVRTECGEYALSAPGRLHGVWGGLSEEERAELRRAS